MGSGPRSPSAAAEGRAQPFTRVDRALYASAWVGFAAVLVVAAWLTPAPGGIGTHTELHLPPCGFYVLFHRPCPSCGMTTAFSWLMHGRPLEALRAQPAGVAVFAVGLLVWLYLPVGWARGRPFAHIFESRASLPVILALIVIILGVWIARVL